jgi:cytochrome P450
MLEASDIFENDDQIGDEIASFLVAGVASMKYLTTNILYYVNQHPNIK